MKTRLSLKHLVPTIMLGLLLIAGTLWAQDSKAFVGDWSGAVFAGAQEIELVCHFKLDEEGNLAGTIDSPSQGASGMALANIKVEGKKITIFFVEFLSFVVTSQNGFLNCIENANT